MRILLIYYRYLLSRKYCKSQIILKYSIIVFSSPSKSKTQQPKYSILAQVLVDFGIELKGKQKYSAPLISSEISRENAGAWVSMDFK